MKPLIILFVVVIALTGCSLSRTVRPLGEGNSAVGGSLGGPLIGNFGIPVPLPQASVFYRRGVTDAFDFDVGIQLPVTSVMGADAGVSYGVLKQRGGLPALSLATHVMIFGNLKAKFEGRAYEQFTGIASWEYGSALIWTGLEGFTQLERGIVRPVILVGADWKIGTNFHFGTEMKYLDFFRDQEFNPVTTFGPFHKGALALQFGLTYHFDKGGK